MNNNIKRYRWRCPVKGCNAMGKKFMPKYKSGKFGRNHLKRKHKIYDKEPIMLEGEIIEDVIVLPDKYKNLEVYDFNTGKQIAVCGNKRELKDFLNWKKDKTLHI